MLFTSPKQRAPLCIYNDGMKDKINSYFAVLLITIAGSGATLLIVHIATSDTLAATFAGSEANYYTSLQQPVLNPHVNQKNGSTR